VAGGEKIAAATYPQIDILVNNLGMYALSDFFSNSDDWQRMFEVNVWSGVRLARTYMKGMFERGHGRVIFISSEVALTPMTSMAHYSAI
jgi:3-oxoacyl-[acyl-carrier protein] reductase